jgi:hypothetical protein
MSWDVGGVRITRVVELVMAFPVDFFAEATPADVAAETWLVPNFVTADGQYLMSLQTFVIEAADLRIVVDTCVGNSKDRPLIPAFHQQDRPFLAQLAAAEFPPESIDLVHPPARRSRRVEHASGQRRVDTDVPPRTLPVRGR